MKFSNPMNEKPYRKWHLIAFYMLLLGIVLLAVCCVVYYTLGENNVLYDATMGGSIGCVVVFYLLNMSKWRCPNCKKPLPLFGPVIECRNCRRSFMDSKGKQVW